MVLVNPYPCVSFLAFSDCALLVLEPSQSLHRVRQTASEVVYDPVGRVRVLNFFTSSLVSVEFQKETQFSVPAGRVTGGSLRSGRSCPCVEFLHIVSGFCIVSNRNSAFGAGREGHRR